MTNINKRLFSTFLGKFVWIDNKELATRFENTTYWHHIDLKPIPIYTDYVEMLGFTTIDKIKYHINFPDGNIFTIIRNDDWTWFYERPDGIMDQINSVDQLQDKYWELAEPTLAKAS